MTAPFVQSGTTRSHEASLIACAYLLGSKPMHTLYQQIAGDLDAARVECVGALTDALIPGIDNVAGLLACTISDPALLLHEPEDYDRNNQLTPAALLYENLYRQTFAWVETHLSEIVWIASLIRRVQDEPATSYPNELADETSLVSASVEA